MTPQEWIFLFLIIPGIRLFRILCDFLRLYLFIDADTIKAVCVSKWADKNDKPDIELTNEVSSYVTYEYDGVTYNKRKLKKQYDLFNVGEEVEIFIDLMDRPRQELILSKELVSIFISMAIFLGEILYFMSVIYPTVHWGY